MVHCFIYDLDYMCENSLVIEFLLILYGSVDYFALEYYSALYKFYLLPYFLTYLLP